MINTAFVLAQSDFSILPCKLFQYI